jgi:PPOX class probable F420-dependent enzyme
VPNIATTDLADLAALREFLQGKRHLVLVTTRSDGRPQVSPVTGVAVGGHSHDEQLRVLVSSYPTRAKTKNLARDGACAVLVLSDDFDGPWVTLYATGSVRHGDDGVDALVEYYRAAAGEHDDWDEYRQAMRDRSKVCLDLAVTDWGPIATGGVPPEFA